MAAVLNLQIKAINDASGVLRAVKGDINDLAGAVDGASGKVGGLSSLLGTGLKVAATAGATAVVALGGAMAGVIVSGTRMAADMEAQLSGIGAILGATRDEIAPLKDLILDLGIDPNLKVNAEEAADAIEMLARNGLDMTQIMGGAAYSTVLLANATGADFGTAADIATDSMAIFNIAAKDMDAAVNGITSVVNNSKFSINDYRLGLAQAGGVAASAGVEFNDFNTVLAGTAPLFASGSDAGTSFKTFLLQLAPTTETAKKAMQELGIITADGSNQFFDASGNLRSMADVSQVLQVALAGLSEQEQNVALKTIFGNDALRTAVSLSKLGAEGFSELQAAMGQTDALESARTRMDNLSGSMEILAGVVDTVKLRIGDAFIPIVRQMVEMLTGFLTANADPIVAFFEHLATGIETVATVWVPALLQAFGTLGQIAGVIGGLLSSISSVLVSGLASALGVSEDSIRSFLKEWLLMLPAFGLAGAAVAAVRAAWAADFLGIRSLVEELAVAIPKLWSTLLAGLTTGDFSAFQAQFQILSAWLHVWFTIQKGKILAWVGEWWNQFSGTPVGSALIAGVSAMANKIRPIVDGIKTQFAALQAVFKEVAAVVAGVAGGSVGKFNIGSLKWSDFIAKLSDWSQYVPRLAWKDIVAKFSEWTQYIPKVDWPGIITRFGAWSDFITKLVWPAAIGAFGSWTSYVTTLVWPATIETFGAWSDYITDIAWPASIETFGSWSDYITEVTWPAAIETFGSWTDYVGKLDWGTIVTDLADWTIYVDTLRWDTFIGVLDWAAGIVSAVEWTTFIPNVLNWAAFITNVTWDVFITKMSRWSEFIEQLDWAAYITGVLDWGAYLVSVLWSDYIVQLDWGQFVTALVDWATWIPVLAWDTFITVLAWTADVVSKLDWGQFITNISDWSTWINALVWDSYVQKLQWGDFIVKLDWIALVSRPEWSDYLNILTWTDYVSGIVWDLWLSKVTWSDFISALDWSTAGLSAIDWTQFIAPITSLEWARFIPAPGWQALIAILDWTDFIPTLKSWSEYVAALDWGALIPDIDWTAFIPALGDWTLYVSGLTWGTFVAGLEWSTFITDLKWPSVSFPGWSTWISRLQWPSISWPGFGAFVSHLQWPSISWPGWSSFIPTFHWPDIGAIVRGFIPSFPGWGNPGGGGNSGPGSGGGGGGFGGSSGGSGSSGGGSQGMFERAALLTYPYGTVTAARAAAAPVGGGDIIINMGGVVLANDLDVETVAWQIAGIIKRNQR